MSIPTEAIEEAADIIWMRANGENGVCGTDRKTHSYAVATEVATAALTAAAPAIQAAAVAEALEKLAVSFEATASWASYVGAEDIMETWLNAAQRARKAIEAAK